MIRNESLVKTKEDIFDIISLYNNNTSITKISKIYHTRNTTISDILKDAGIRLDNTNNKYRTSKELATQRKYYLNEDIFENIDSDDKAYWLGFLYADGNIYVPKGKTNDTKGIRMEISLMASDDYHLHNFSHFIESNYPVSYRMTKCAGKEYPSCRIAFNSIKMGKDLIKWGCVPNKSLILKYPEKLDEKFFGSFLCGYFDGDGCLSFTHSEEGYKRCIVSMNGTYEFLSVINEKLNELGIMTRRGVVPTSSKTFNLAISSYNFNNFYNLIYGKTSYILGRKFDKFRDMLFERKEEFDISEVAKLARLIY